MVVAWVAITDCITSLPSASSTATEMVLWWTSRPIYLMLSIGCSFREVGYCSAQQPNPTAKGAPFYNACPRLASVFWTLTWAEEGSGRPTEHFRLTISGRPLRFDLHHSVLAESIAVGGSARIYAGEKFVF